MIDRIEKTALGHFRYLPEVAGFPVKSQGTLTTINCGLGSSMFNIVFGALEGTEKDSEVIQRIVGDYKQPFAWWVPQSGCSEAFTEMLLKAGFVVETTEHAMICAVEALPDMLLTDSLPIEQVLTSEQVDAFVSVLDPYDSTARLFYEQLSLPLLQGQEKLFLGYQEGKPAVIGITFHQGDTVGLFSLLTDETYRGRGLGTQMMRHLIASAVQQGAKYITLSASSDSGYRIYERLGFKTVGAFECFEWKG